MKNYGYTWGWNKNPEYTINVCTHWNRWALPFVITWHYFNDARENKCYSFDITILCFHFDIEVWRFCK